MKKLLAALLMGLGLGACPSEYEGPCRTNADCVRAPADLCDQTLALSCVSGECVELCETDTDCREDPLDSEDRRSCGGVNPNRFRVCNRLRCEAGCVPEGAMGEGIQCPAGQTCAPDGRCAIFAESFEPPTGETSISLPVLREICRTGGSDPSSCSKWDDLPRAKRNTESRISFSGLEGCDRTAFGAEETCAGPAGEGLFFLRLKRVPNSASGAVFDYTCAACKCCADCLDGTFRNDSVRSCLGVPIPDVGRMCVDPNEASCAAICSQCEAECPPVPAGRRPTSQEETGLNQCQVMVAARTCAACISYEDCRLQYRTSTCQLECRTLDQIPDACDAVPSSCAECPRSCLACSDETPTGGESVRTQCQRLCGACPTCEDCLGPLCTETERNCKACQLAVQERENCPGCTDIWGPLQDICDAAGAGACVQGPVFVNRAELTEAEQALVSPVVSLQGVAGDVRLSFQYIPFRVGAQFFPVSSEPAVPQVVAVQFCGADCDNEANWVDSGRTLPTADERNNGLSAGEHSARDWTAYHFEVAIPEAVRTSSFRFRFLPRLSDDAVLGVDNVLVRIQP